MSERSQANPNQLSTRIEGAPEGLQLESLDKVVGSFVDINADFEAEKPEVDFQDYYEGRIDALLTENGFTDNLDDESQHTEYEFAKQVYTRVAGYTTHEWLTRPEGEEVKRRNLEHRAVAERYSSEATMNTSGTELTEAEQATPESSEQEKATETLEKLESNLADAREKLAAAAAKRQNSLWSGNFTGNSDVYDKLHDEYNDALRALGQQHISLHEDYTDESKNIIALTILFDEQEKLRDLTTEKLENKRITKVIKWMNKGNAATRIAKGVAIGAGAGLAGSFLAGAVGAGIVAGGAVAATRFARGFALKDHDKRGMSSFEDTVDVSEADIKVGPALHFAESDQISAADKVLGAQGSFEADTRNEQKKRRKAAAYGIGSMAVGSVLGYGLHAAVEWASGKDLTLIDNAAEKTKNFLSGEGFRGDIDAPDIETLPEPDLDGDGLADSIDNDIDGDGATNENDFAPRDPNVSEQPLTPREQVFDGRLGARELTPEGREMIMDELNGHTVKPGDTVWGLSERMLEEQGIKNPTVYEIDATKDMLLSELKSSGYVDSRGWLSVGDTIKLK